MRREVVLLAIAALLLVGGGQAGASPIPPAGVDIVHIVSRPILASRLMGMAVHDSKGARVGTVEDLALSPEQNRIAYAVVALPEAVYGVELLDLRLSLERDHVTLLPDREGLTSIGLPGKHPLAGTWLGRPLYGQDGAVVGKLHDILIDAHAGDSPIVLLAKDGLLHPLPLDALLADRGRAMLTIDTARLDPSRGFTAAQLASNLRNNGFLQGHARYADHLTIGEEYSGAGQQLPVHRRP